MCFTKYFYNKKRSKLLISNSTNKSEDLIEMNKLDISNTTLYKRREKGGEFGLINTEYRNIKVVPVVSRFKSGTRIVL